MSVKRIDPNRAWARMRDPDSDTLVVCAYEDEGKCDELGISGALDLKELRKRRPSKDTELVFYCN